MRWPRKEAKKEDLVDASDSLLRSPCFIHRPLWVQSDNTSSKERMKQNIVDVMTWERETEKTKNRERVREVKVINQSVAFEVCEERH